MCFQLAGGVSPNGIAAILIFKNIFAGFFDGAAGPIVMEMSATCKYLKYTDPHNRICKSERLLVTTDAAAIMGVINAANNITLYAISAQVIGPMLDAGGCRNQATTPAEHTGSYWDVDESCIVDASHSLISQKDDLICVRGDGIGNVTQTCLLTVSTIPQPPPLPRIPWILIVRLLVVSALC